MLGLVATDIAWCRGQFPERLRLAINPGASANKTSGADVRTPEVRVARFSDHVAEGSLYDNAEHFKRGAKTQGVSGVAGDQSALRFKSRCAKPLAMISSYVF
jgi:hypothetical protein